LEIEMNLTVCLSIVNHDAFGASIENDEEMESLNLAEGTNAKRTCAAAAKRLRDLADRFDALAREPEPCKVTTHKRINRRTRTAIRPNAQAQPADQTAPPTTPCVAGSADATCSIPAKSKE
jgi:hypothetical protein